MSIIRAIPLDLTALSTTAYAAASCGTDPVVLNSYFETGFPLPTKLRMISMQ